MSALARVALRRTLRQVSYVRPVRPGRATGLVREVYRELEHDFGLLAPPIALHSPAPGPLAASWAMLRETLVATGRVDRATKESVAAAVSSANTCPYCVEVHTAALAGAAPGTELTEWARAGGRRATAAAPPCPAEQVPEVLGVATTFHYLNRMVTVFLPESPLPAGMPDAARGTAHRMLAGIMRPAGDRRPGTTAGLLPDAALPPDLAWAAGSPSVAAAFAGAAAALDAVPVPDAVAGLVREHLADWDGTAHGPSRAWVEDAVRGLPAGDRATGRLALLTAVSPHQVDDTVVAAYRRHQPDDARLVELTSWAALTAARQVSAWSPALRRL